MQDSNPLVRFLKRPFVSFLAKLSVAIIVGWNVFMAMMVFTFIGMGIFLFTFAAGVSSAKPIAYDSLGQLEYVYGDSSSANQLLMISVKGEIIGDGPTDGWGSFANVTSGYEVKQKLFDAAQRPEIKGVLLAIDSPGGTIYGGRAIAEGVQYFQERTKQPVFAHIEGLGASGAYMAALPAKQIIADYGTDVGSIGVIMGPFKYYNGVISESGGLLEGGVITQNGIETVMLTAGKSKDVGSPYRRLTQEEKNQLQQSINNEYDQFVDMVTANRGIDGNTVRNQIGAMIYDPKSAQQLKLIDGTASREKTYASLAQAANIKDYQVMREATTFGLLENLLGAIHHAPQKKAAASFDTCNLTQVKLAYYGSVTDLCKQ